MIWHFSNRKHLECTFAFNQHNTFSHIMDRLVLISGSISISDKNLLDTDNSACFGHLEYQSMVQQLINEGNIRHRVRNRSPTGEKHKTKCKLSRMRFTNVCHVLSGVMGISCSFMKGCMKSSMRLNSSFSVNRFGTSPLCVSVLVRYQSVLPCSKRKMLTKCFKTTSY